MTATDELRRMLEERGVGTYKHEAPAAVCLAFFDGNRWHDCWESLGGEVNVTFSMTPEQAVEATLGRGTCRNVHEPPKDTAFWPVPHFKCSRCGATHVSMDYVYYCPSCGRRVRDE